MQQYSESEAAHFLALIKAPGFGARRCVKFMEKLTDHWQAVFSADETTLERWGFNPEQRAYLRAPDWVAVGPARGSVIWPDARVFDRQAILPQGRAPPKCPFAPVS